MVECKGLNTTLWVKGKMKKILFNWLYGKQARHYFHRIGPLIKPNEKVIDIGCGHGFLGEMISKKAKVTLLDVTSTNMSSLPLTMYDGKSIPFKNNSFDVGILRAVLHHANNPEALLKESARVCKRLIIVEDTLWSPWDNKFYTFMDKLTSWQQDIKAGLHFKSNGDWIDLFEKNKLILKSSQYFRSTLWYLHQSLFELTRTK